MKLTRIIIVAWISALAYAAMSFFDARTPGAISPFAWLVAWPAHRIIIVIALVRLPWSWRQSGLQTLLAVAACCAASTVGTKLGLNARDRRFFEWRLPVYRSVVDRIKGTTALPGFDKDRHSVELIGAESEAARDAFAWLSPSGELVVQFFWAGVGPPPKHALYTYVAAGQRDESEVWGTIVQRMDECWYESWD
jgi:hypothetical protein